EIERGIIDSSYRAEKYDFGIDALFITSSSDFIESPDELIDYNDESKFKIQLFQFKRSNGLGQDDLLKLRSGIEKILVSGSIAEEDNLYLYNRLISLNEIKVQLYNNFNSSNIEIQIHIV